MTSITPEGLAERGLLVKPLEWHDAGFENCASSVAGYHRVFERNGLWRAVIHTRADAYFVAECETEEAAKAAAQADYEARILAALAAQLAVAQEQVAGLRAMLMRAKNELRLIRMKDTGAVYDVLLRTDIDAALAPQGTGKEGAE